MSNANPEVMTAQPASGNKNRLIAVGLVSGAILAGLAVVSCDNDNGSAAPEVTAPVPDPEEIPGAIPATDESLRLTNFACGGEKDVTSMQNLGYKFDFYTASQENLELAQSNYDVIVTNPQTGMGEQAFNILLDKGLANSATVEAFDANPNAVLTGIEDNQFDKLLGMLTPVVLNQSRDYVNGDCRNNRNQVTLPSPDIPFISLQAGSSVETVLLTDADYMEWRTAYDKFVTENGTTYQFDVLDITTVNGESRKAVVINANGCDNQIRITHRKPTPTTTTTTGGGSTTTVGGSTTTTIHTETIPPKNDDGELPGDPDTPADQDPGTPDNPGEGPAGQEPEDDGYLPSETTVAPQPPRATAPAPTTTAQLPPATTGVQVIAPPAPATTAAGSGGAPDISTMPTTPGA